MKNPAQKAGFQLKNIGFSQPNSATKSLRVEQQNHSIGK